MQVQSSGVARTDEIRLVEVGAHLWRQRWLMCLVFALCVAAAIGVGVLMPDYYRAAIVVSPVSDDASGGKLGGLASLASQFGNVASLAGLGSAGGGQKAEAVAVLQSEALTSAYIEAEHLLPILFASKWNSSRAAWNDPASPKVPTVWKGNVFFRDRIRTVNIDAKTGLVTMRIEWRDPVLAAKWANDLVKRTNETLRQRTIAEAQRNISYLKQQAAQTDMMEARQAIFSLMQSEINKTMAASGSEEFALKVIDPAVAPEKPANAALWIWALAGVLVGAFLAIAVALARPLRG